VEKNKFSVPTGDVPKSKRPKGFLGLLFSRAFIELPVKCVNMECRVVE
jgi:hypothetical protein